VRLGEIDERMNELTVIVDVDLRTLRSEATHAVFIAL
jgi:hypothetical protein